MNDDRLYLIHITECIQDIADYVRDGRASFMASKLIQDAVLRKMQVLAQSTIRLSEESKSAHPEVNWAQIRGFRNVIVHDYLQVDLKILWDIIENNLPGLRIAVADMLEALGSNSN